MKWGLGGEVAHGRGGVVDREGGMGGVMEGR